MVVIAVYKIQMPGSHTRSSNQHISLVFKMSEVGPDVVSDIKNGNPTTKLYLARNLPTQHIHILTTLTFLRNVDTHLQHHTV